MAVTNLSSKKSSTILQQILTDNRLVNFAESEKTFWDPKNQTIFYNPNSEHYIYSILHELGHVKFKHTDYKFDIELLMMESEAWGFAKSLAKKYKVTISDDHIQDCLDSYREWIHKRSECPSCKQTGMQENNLQYRCLNCGDAWSVSQSRFCRSYRRKIKRTPSVN